VAVQLELPERQCCGITEAVTEAVTTAVEISSSNTSHDLFII
jgi:hypothetical protein